MSEQEVVAAKVERRQRRRKADDEDDSMGDEPEDVQVARPARPRAKAPSAAKAPAAAPVAPPSVHFDPKSTAEGVAALEDRVATGLTMEDVVAMDFDLMTYATLQSILTHVTRQAVEEHMVFQEQKKETSHQQQQTQRVERFLDAALSNASGSGENEDHEDGYTYNEMLTRLFEALNRNNEGSAMTERNQLPVPILEKIGKKKTVISNFGRICEVFHRPLEDVKDFIEKELCIRGNLDSNSALILKLEIRKATDFDRILIKYLDEYVKCNSCHRIDTTLTKDGRRMELRCNWCTATRTVMAMGTVTFSALLDKRSRTRAAMTL